MPGPRPLAAVLVGLLYAAVSLAPCPSVVGPAHTHRAPTAAAPPCHATAHSAPPPRTLAAPCPCGCGQRPAASPTAKLGPVLVAAAPRLKAVEAAFAAPPAGADRLVEADLAAPDPVPRAA